MSRQHFHLPHHLLPRLLRLPQNGLQIPKRQLIRLFVLAIVLMPFLDGIVRQVPVEVGWVMAELFDAGAQVALFVPVGVQLARDGGDQDVATDVEFAVAVQEWGDVVLD